MELDQHHPACAFSASTPPLLRRGILFFSPDNRHQRLLQVEFKLGLDFVFNFDCSAGELDRLDPKACLLQRVFSRSLISTIGETSERQWNDYRLGLVSYRQVAMNLQLVC